KIG
ncbi:unnamed protein product, partial [Onchocerca ochengi]